MEQEEEEKILPNTEFRSEISCKVHKMLLTKQTLVRTHNRPETTTKWTASAASRPEPEDSVHKNNILHLPPLPSSFGASK